MIRGAEAAEFKSYYIKFITSGFIVIVMFTIGQLILGYLTLNQDDPVPNVTIYGRFKTIEYTFTDGSGIQSSSGSRSYYAPSNIEFAIDKASNAKKWLITAKWTLFDSEIGISINGHNNSWVKSSYISLFGILGSNENGKKWYFSHFTSWSMIDEWTGNLLLRSENYIDKKT